jgi:ferric-dicitrate binding protein FerR (iron transport regulator)
MKENEDLEQDRDVATLLRVAGKRHDVPRERAERIRATARAEWQVEVRRGSRRRRAWAAAALAAAATVAAVWLGLPSRPAAVPVESLSGAAWARAAGGDGAERRRIAVGDEVTLESAVETDEGGRVALRLVSGHSLRLDASTRVRLLGAASVTLDRGTLYVDSGPAAAAAAALSVHTALGVVQETGTQFEVRLEGDSLLVRLREGAAVVRHRGQVHEVAAGNELGLSAGGTVTRRPVPTHGPEWDWLVGVTPMLDLEGRSARAFLDWVARERGWTLAFEHPTVARSAEGIVLAGTVRMLTLDEVLDAVLPTCRLTYRVVDGVLVIGAAGPESA